MTSPRERLIRYLDSTGWIVPEESTDIGELWRHPHTEFLMPVPYTIDDTGLDWETVITRLSMIERRTASDVLADVNQQASEAEKTPQDPHHADDGKQDKTAELDQLLGIEKVLDPQIVRQLQQVHEKHQRVGRRFNAAVVRQMVLVVTITFLIVTSVLMFGSLMDLTQPAPRSSWEQIVRAWRHSYGAVTPGLALVVNAALLALVASINIALALSTSRGNRHDDTITNLWGKMLRRCAFVAGSSAQGFSILQITGISDKKVDYGTTAAAFLLSFLAMFLSITLVEYSDSIVRAHDLVEAEKQRQSITRWLTYIRSQGVPVTMPAGRGLRLRWCPKVPRIAVVGLIFPLGAVLYTYAAMEITVWVRRGHLFVPNSSGDIQLSLYTIGYAAGITYVVGMFTWQRWSTVKTGFVRLRMTSWPITFRVLYVVTVFGMMTLLSMNRPEDWARGLILALAMAGPFIFLPCAAWLALGLSRMVTLHRAVRDSPPHRPGWVSKVKRWPGNLVLWLAAPIWQNVSKSLEDSYRSTTTRRDQAHDHEAELLKGQTTSEPVPN